MLPYNIPAYSLPIYNEKLGLNLATIQFNVTWILHISLWLENGVLSVIYLIFSIPLDLDFVKYWTVLFAGILKEY